jgi:hypothetical protein
MTTNVRVLRHFIEMRGSRHTTPQGVNTSNWLILLTLLLCP